MGFWIAETLFTHAEAILQAISHRIGWFAEWLRRPVNDRSLWRPLKAFWKAHVSMTSSPSFQMRPLIPPSSFCCIETSAPVASSVGQQILWVLPNFPFAPSLTSRTVELGRASGWLRLGDTPAGIRSTNERHLERYKICWKITLNLAPFSNGESSLPWWPRPARLWKEPFTSRSRILEYQHWLKIFWVGLELLNL